MFRTALVTCALVLATAVIGPAAAHAQTVPIQVTYFTGWNMVGGPQGTDFSAAAAVYAYGPDGYYTPAGRIAAGCVGLWAQFSAPAVVNIPSGSVGPTQTCVLLPGWNVVGNPFSGIAQLPTGTVAYRFNPDTFAYDQLSSIPPGGAVWIYSPDASSIVLTYAPYTPRPPAQIVVGDVYSPGPYTIRVGDTIELILAADSAYTATADTQYLHLEGAGLTGPLDCVGASCSLTLSNRFWIWRAEAVGTTSISVAPRCADATPPCEAPSVEIAVNIVA